MKIDENRLVESIFATSQTWRLFFALFLLLVNLLELPAVAASFDCDKVGTEVEKMICADADISRLDTLLNQEYKNTLDDLDKAGQEIVRTQQRQWLASRNRCKDPMCIKEAYWSRQEELTTIAKLSQDLDKAYQDVLGKADTMTKERLQTEQQHWFIHTRNLCRDLLCLKHAYWSRQAALDTFFEPIGDAFIKESDKAAPIKEVLASHTFYQSTFAPQEFCDKVFEDLKTMNDIDFVEPVIKVNSYEDPALDPWKQHCKSVPPFHYNAGCLPGYARQNFDMAGEEGLKNILLYCEVSYGIQPYKIFELPPERAGDKKRLIFYSDNSYGPMNADWRKPAIGGYSAGFIPMECQDDSKNVSPFSIKQSGTKRNYSGIVVYSGRYFYYELNNTESATEKDGTWRLEIEEVNLRRTKRHQSCSWSLLKPVTMNTSNPGGK